MGVNIRDIVPVHQVDFSKLSGKTVAVDAYNAIYQFLATIRQFDGAPLVNRRGKITSHLSGIFYRSINLLEKNIKIIYVFDGKPPSLKETTITERIKIREESEQKWKEALSRGEYVKAKKYAQGSSRISPEIVAQSKKLLSLMGIPFVEAPSEGEAQAAYMNLKGDVWACGSQDWDSLLFGAKRLVRNLTISGRRKLPNKNVYVKIEPEIAYLEETLNENNITREQLIDIGILIGTDYNEGVKGIGVKTAVKLIREYGSIEGAVNAGKIKELPFNVEDIRKLFLNPNIRREYEISWGEPDEDGIIEFLHKENDFSLERVNKGLERLSKVKKTRSQSSLDAWFR